MYIKVFKPRIAVLTSGKEYIFEENTTQIITPNGWIDAVETCEGVISIKSSNSGTSATISKSSGNILLEYCHLKDITATGGATFTANNSIDGGNNSGWNINYTMPRNLYWVGGTGNWSDSTHWSLSSGGIGGECPPTLIDDVYFNANSGFSINGDTVLIDILNAFSNNMDWTGALNHPTFRNSQGTNTSLFIHGSLTFIQNMDFDYNGNIKFEATDTGNTITSGLQYLNNIYFIGDGGEWTLQDSLSSNDITHSYGTLVTDNHSIQINDDYYSIGNGLRHLDFGSSTIYMIGNNSSYFSIEGSNITADLDSTTIIYTSIYTYIYNRILNFAHNTGTITLYKVIFENGIQFSFYQDRIIGRGYLGGTSNSLSIIKYVEAHNKTSINRGHYHHCNLHDDGYINDNNSFDTLKLSSGGEYIFQDNKTQLITSNGWIDAPQTCNGMISVKSSNPGNNATISKSSGNILLESCYLKDIIATGGATFAANNSMDGGNNMGWVFNNNAMPRNLYWVGGAGNWSDSTHWSLSSGGIGGECPPTLVDDVYFNANSGFVINNEVVLMDMTNIFCQNMDWTGTLNHPTFATNQGSSTDLCINGSLTFIQNMNFNYNGNIKFESTNTGNTITSGLQYLKNIYFTGNGGDWTLQDSLSAYDIRHSYGTLITDNHSIQINDDYYSTGNGLRHLDFGSSTIYMTGSSLPYFSIQESNVTADLDSTTIIYNSNSTYYYGRVLNLAHNSGTITLYKVIFNKSLNNSSSNQIKGSGYLGANSNSLSIIKYVEAHNKTLIQQGHYHHCNLFDDGNINGNNSFDTLKLSRGGEYVFQENRTQLITSNGWIDAVGTGSFPIRMRSSSSGTQATIKSLNDTICLNYIFMQDLDTAGTADFRAGEISADVFNNTGWEFIDCCSTFEISELFEDHDTTICLGQSIDVFVYYGQCEGCTFYWDDGDVSELRTITPDTSGVYYVTATRWPEGCSSTDSIVINVLPAISVTLPNDTILCNQSNHLIDATTSFTRSYEWQNGDTTPIFTAITTDEYYVELTDSFGCISHDTIMVTFNEVEVDLGQDTLICYSNTLLLTAGTNTNLTYTWQDGSNNSTYLTTTEGTYFAAAMDSIGCTDLDTITVGYLPTIEIQNEIFLNCTNVQSTIIPNLTTGQFLWSNGSTTSTTTTFSPTTAGIILVKYTDLDNCTSYDTAQAIAPILPTVDLGNDTIICIGNTVTFEATRPNIIGYTWQDNSTDSIFTTGMTGSYHVSIIDTNGCTTEDTIYLLVNEVIPNIGVDTAICDSSTLLLNVEQPNMTYVWQDNSTNAIFLADTGIYHVTLTDTIGCIGEDSIHIGYRPTVDLGEDFSFICDSLIVLTSNIIGNYTWSNGSNNNSITTNEEGRYILEVTDLAGCYSTDTVTMTQISHPTIFLGNDTILCNQSNHLIDATASFTRSYEWQNGDTTPIFTATTTDEYYVELTDSFGCISHDTIMVTFNEVEVDLGQDTLICYSNTLLLTAGTSTNLTYTWQDGSNNSTYLTTTEGTYFAAAMDSIGCIGSDTITIGYLPTIEIQNEVFLNCTNVQSTIIPNLTTGQFLWSNGSTTSTTTTFSPTTAGIISVKYTDLDNCTSYDTAQAIAPILPTVDLGNDTIICIGNTVTFKATRPNIVGYTWQDNSTDSIFTTGMTGSYHVSIIDTNGCIAEDTIHLLVNEVIPNIGVDTAICDSSTLLLNVEQPNMTYVWQDNSTNAIFLADTGIYHVTLTDTIGCIGEDSIHIGYRPTVDLGEDFSFICDSLIVLISNIIGNYTWSTGSNNNSITTNEEGRYILEVTDLAGCYSTDTVTMTQISHPTIFLGNDTILCNQSNYLIDATTSFTRSYEWQNGDTTPIFTAITTDEYYVELTDSFGCISHDTIMVTFNEVEVDLGQDTLICYSNTLLLTAGTSTNLTYTWQDSSNNSTYLTTTEGTYFAAAMDSIGCIGSDTITVGYLPTIEIQNEIFLNCTNVQSTIIPNLTTGQFLWSNGSTTSTITPTDTGTIWLQYIDLENCVSNDTTEVIAPILPPLNLGNDTLLCENDILMLSAAHSDIVDYEWQDGSDADAYNVITAGIYNIAVTSTNGCMSYDTITVDYFTQNLFNHLPTDTTICENTLWFVDATVQGAIQYQWQDGINTATYNISNAGNYSLIATSTEGCAIQYMVTVNMNYLPTTAYYLPTDTILCENNQMILNAYTEHATDYEWVGESAYYGQNLPHDSTFIVTYPGTYSVNISNECSEFTKYIEVEQEDCGCYPYIPNAFSPNDDGRNDEFQVYTNCIMQDFVMRIFDRQGNQVFVSTDVNQGWDGTFRGQQMGTGVFVWQIQFKALNAKGEWEKQLMSGDVTILR